MPMRQHILEELQKENLSEEIQNLKSHLLSMVDASREKMKNYWPQWDKYDDSYKAIMYADKDDIHSIEKGDPKKLVVQLTREQILTLEGFLFMVFIEQPKIKEFQGTNDIATQRASRILTELLDRDLEWSKFRGCVARQFFTDIAKYGIGILKWGWFIEERFEKIKKNVDIGSMLLMGGAEDAQIELEVEENIVEWEGNIVRSVTPFRFYPDPNYPFSDFQQGAFCAHDEEYGLMALKCWEMAGDAAGVDYIKEWSHLDLINRRLFSRHNRNQVEFNLKGNNNQRRGLIPYAVTEIQAKLTPSMWKINPNKKLGDSEKPELWVTRIANDDRIIFLKELEDGETINNQFTFSVVPFEADQHQTVLGGLADTLDEIQFAMNWNFNAEQEMTRKIINPQMIFRTSSIEMQDLQNESSKIRVREHHKGSLDDAMKPVNTPTNSGQYIQNMATLRKMAREHTGLTDNMTGQYSSGRRSAREASAVNEAAKSRMAPLIRAIDDLGIKPMARGMIKNHQKYLSGQTSVQILGDKDGRYVTEEVFPTVEEIGGEFPFKPLSYDLPESKAHKMAALQELVIIYLQNPVAMMLTGDDISYLVDYLKQERGIHNVHEMKLDKAERDFFKMFAYNQITGGAYGQFMQRINGQGGGVEIPGGVGQVQQLGGEGAIGGNIQQPDISGALSIP